MWFDDRLKDEPTERFRVWTEEDEAKLQEKKQGPKHIKYTLLGRTRERNIIRFIDSINNVPMTEQQIQELIQKLEDAKLSTAVERSEQVTTIKFKTADEIDEINDETTHEMDSD
jgi:late competence protein required for DNA uptake (superfamily II DNA/RNA helicase)